LHDVFNHKYFSQNGRVLDQRSLYIIDRKMDPNWNGQQWQQQYHDPNQQYAQPLQEQSTGTPHYDYSSAAQQTPYKSQVAQQGGSQPSYRGLMQQTPTQQPLPNAQLQQQPSPNAHPQQQQSYQQYYQGHSSVILALSAPVGPWTQPQPDFQRQTATNNATTTTTTTTTTTKSTKETQASQPQYATSSSAFDFFSLMQHLPAQQAAQQAPQQVAQQQQSVNYSQTVQSQNQQQTVPPPPPDFSQFMQNNSSQTQNTVDFSQLLQTAPPPQPQVSQAPPVVQTPVPPQKPQSSKQASKSTNKSTTTTTTSVVGSTSRQKAAEKGKTELRRFDKDVSNQLKKSYDGICPMGFDYYAARQGYICGGGSHFFTHDEVEAMLKYGREPRLERVNSGAPYERLVTPPPGNGDGSGLEPLFWTAKQLSEVELAAMK
jgi:hypothetical protein